MNRLILALFTVFLVLFSVKGESQRHKVILNPPAPADTQGTPTQAATQRKPFDPVQAERDARELSDLAKSIPLDVEHVNKGLMPKDMIEKLKRIEKLSKHLRSEISPQ